MADTGSLPYRPCVGIMLVNPRREIFVGRRIDTKIAAWQMPQGGIDPGETPRQAAYREMCEEVGTDNAEFIAESREWYSYDLPENLVGKLWGGRYRGQRQKWFLLQFNGIDEDIRINTPHAEFSDWRWVSSDELTMLIVPLKRSVYVAVVGEFRDYLNVKPVPPRKPAHDA